jgi:poly-beta-1,6-N-acetyl-D-glucosamine synthase
MPGRAAPSFTARHSSQNHTPKAATRTRGMNTMVNAHKVVIVLENDTYAPGSRVCKEAEGLSSAGFAVEVLAPRERGFPTREITRGVKVTRFRSRESYGALGQTAITHLAAACSISVLVLRRIVSSHRGMLHVHSPPDIFSPVLWLARLRGWSTVFDHHDDAEGMASRRVSSLETDLSGPSPRDFSPSVSPHGILASKSSPRANSDMEVGDSVKLAIVACFVDEAQHLPTLLASIAGQTQPPEQLLLVDDGSRDPSYEIAASFAREHTWAKALRRPLKPPSSDRLGTAGVVRAFQWGQEHLQEPWDIVVKLDGDLQLQPELFEIVRQRFSSTPRLGITGPYLSTLQANGELRREDNPVEHVRGATKFYRRSCYEQIAPLPPILGWDTIDELRARSKGWATQAFELPAGDCIHLRPLGEYDGRLRSFRRRGRCAWGYGAHPVAVLLGSIYRLRERPLLLCGLNYLCGWLVAAARRDPRAEPSLRAYRRHEDLTRLRQRLRDALVRPFTTTAQVTRHHRAQTSNEGSVENR